jgi:hypothetical protein
LLKGVGYKLESCGEGLFEIADFPEEVKKEFSKRREEIEAVLKERNWSGGAAASAVTLLTRNHKEEYDLNVLKEDWRKSSDSMGFDAVQFVKESLSPSPKSFFQTIKESLFTEVYGLNLSKNLAKEAIEVGIEVISQKTSVFSRRDLMTYAMMHTLVGEKSVTIEELNQALDNKIEAKLLYLGKDPYTEQTMLTTPWQLTLETETLQRIENNKNVLEPISSHRYLTDFIKKYQTKGNFTLTPSQTSALKDFLTCKDRFMAIQGFAGTGKTTLLNIVREIASEKGYTIRGVTVGSSAANEMTDKSGIKTDVFPVVYNELKRAPKGSLEKTIFIVDEASMLSSPQGHELIKLVEKKAGRLYQVGDDFQLPSTKNGRMFGLTQDYGIKTAKLTDIIRQKDENLKKGVEAAIAGDVYEAVNKISNIKAYESYDERIQQFARQYIDLSLHARDRTLLFAPSHKNRRDITAIIRQELVKENILSEKSILNETLLPKNIEEKQWYHARYYASGDVIRFNLNLPRYGIKSGDYLTVGPVKKEQLRNETLVLTNSDNKQINFKLSALPDYDETKAGLTRTIEIYQKSGLELRENDTLMWTKNFKKENITNSERATVLNIKEDAITIKMQNGQIKDFQKNSIELKHLDHGYVHTNYKVQGKDKFYGIGFLESSSKESATLRNYYVEISRAIMSMTIITDDKQDLMRALSYNFDEKKSAIDFVSKNQVSAHNERFMRHGQSLDLHHVIDKKETKEDLWHSFEAKVQEYRANKENNKSAPNAKLAFEIINNPKLYRLAKTRLSYSEHSYRQDALKLSQLRYFNRLGEDAKKDFVTIKNYVQAINKVNKSLGTYKNHETKSNFKNLVYRSDARNELAYTIYQNIDKYKNHLSQFSIGLENRLGLSAHKIDNEINLASKKLEQLAQHAHKFSIKKNVLSFFDCSDVNERKELAHAIKEQAKESHRHVLQLAHEKNKDPSHLWLEIKTHAKEYQDSLYKASLPPKEQGIFVIAKEFKTIGHEMRGLLNEKDSIDEQKYLEKLNHFKQRRELLAVKLISEGTQKESILSYFKIDKDTLKKNAASNQFEADVKTINDNTAGIKAKLEAAIEIALDMKGHYPKIKNYNLSTEKLQQYVRVAQRQERLDNLVDADKIAYKEVTKYKALCKRSATLWKAIYEEKDKNFPTSQANLNKALLESSVRNHQAIQVSKLASKEMLESENIKIETLNNHANEHKEKEKKVDNLMVERIKLFNQISSKEGDLNKEERQFWVKNYTQNSYQVNKILAFKELYSGINTQKLKDIDEKYKGLIAHYELENLAENPKTNNVLCIKNGVDLSVTNNALMANPRETYMKIFGEPKKINNKCMKYSGGLFVSLSGSKAGLWYDFVNEEGGGPIDAIMREKNMSFKEALKYASEITNTQNITVVKRVDNYFQNKQQDELEKKNKIKSAKSIWNNAIDIKGTIAETYLKEHRKIKEINQLNVKILPKNVEFMNVDSDGKLHTKINKIPALIIPATNKNGEITGVQRIYLDEKTGNKNKFMDNPKLSKGILKGSAGIIQKGKDNKRIYLAEGPETAATICQVDKNSTVITSFGLGNMGELKNVIKSINPKQIIIAGDNDANHQIKEKTLKIAQDLRANGYDTCVAFPEKIGNKEKTDWNDVLVLKGNEEVKKQLENQLFKHEKGFNLSDIILKINKDENKEFTERNDTRIIDTTKENLAYLNHNDLKKIDNLLQNTNVRPHKEPNIIKETEREL